MRNIIGRLAGAFLALALGTTLAAAQSRVTIAVGGSALVKSAEKVRQKAIKIAAHQLEAAEEDMVYDQASGKIHVKGAPDRAKAFDQISMAAYTAHNLPAGLEPGLEEQAFYDPANFTFPNLSLIHI